MKNFNKIIQTLKLFFIGNLKSYLATKNKKLLKKNQSLLNKYDNERIFILYSGRSINNYDLSIFKDEYVMAANLLVLHNKFKELDVDFYCYTGSWEYSLYKYMSWGLFEIYAGLNSKAKLFLNASSYFWINNTNYCGILDDRDKFKDNTYFISNENFILEGGSNVNCDLPKSLHGVLSRSIGIAIDLGFKEIYLVGADYSKDPLNVGHFYGSTDFITNRTEEENITNNQIKLFAEKRNIKLINIVEQGFSSPIYKSIGSHQLNEVLQKSDKI